MCCIDVHGLFYHQGPDRCLWSVLPLAIMLMSWIMLPLKAISMSMVCAVLLWPYLCTRARLRLEMALVCVWPISSQKPCWCPWPVLLRRVRMASVACAVVAEGCVDFRDLSCHWRSFWGLWYVLMLGTTWISMVCARADWKGQGIYFCNDINVRRHTGEKEGHRRLLWQPITSPPEQ